jgi:hypothetical protein
MAGRWKWAAAGTASTASTSSRPTGRCAGEEKEDARVEEAAVGAGSGGDGAEWLKGCRMSCRSILLYNYIYTSILSHSCSGPPLLGYGLLDWADVTAYHLRLVHVLLDWEDVAADSLDWVYSLHARVVSVLCIAE